MNYWNPETPDPIQETFEAEKAEVQYYMRWGMVFMVVSTVIFVIAIIKIHNSNWWVFFVMYLITSFIAGRLTRKGKDLLDEMKNKYLR